MTANRTLWGALHHIFRLMDEKNFSLIAAGVAFYGILVVFPGLAKIIALWGVVGDPAAVAVEMAEFKAVLPVDVYTLIDGQLRALAQADGLTLGWARPFLSLWPYGLREQVLLPLCAA